MFSGGAFFRRATIATPIALLALAAGFTTPALAGAEACPNEQIRVERGSTHLPDCRAYELVSPVYKGGYSITGLEAVAPDGESVAFGSLGAFAGATANIPTTEDYIARRGGTGWSTAPLTVPAALSPFGYLIDLSPTLSSTLSTAQFGSNTFRADFESIEAVLLLHDSNLPDTAADFEMVGEGLRSLDEKHFNIVYGGSSPDFSHVVFSEPAGNQLLPEAVHTGAEQLYDLFAGDGGEPPALRLVGLNNSRKPIEPSCQVELGSASGKNSHFNAVAADGGEIFFTPACGAPQLFMRVGGAKTVEVSRPMSGSCPRGEVPCPGSSERNPTQFQGASEDGSKVFFTASLGATQPPLVSGDTDSSNNLYMARIGCPSGEGEECERANEAAGTAVKSLVEVTHDPSGEPAEVQGVVAMARDGSRVYFVARGVLGEGPNAEGRAPLKGADNLYVYDSVSGAAPVFVADLCSGSEESGVVEDVHCPADETRGENGRNDTGLWTVERPEARLNECGSPNVGECVGDREPGRFLVFSTYARLLAGDTDNAKDVYRYDAATGVLERVSMGEGGYDANGNGAGCQDTQCDAAMSRNSQPTGTLLGDYGLGSRAISEDGTRIVFGTAEPLSPAAVNGVENVYEWRELPSGEGSVALISTGSSGEPVDQFVISGSGNDIFFRTSQGLVAQDTDGQYDLYDARLDGGFPVAPAEVRPCSGDACQGPLTNPAPLLVPGSVSQAPGENIAAPTPANAKPKAKPKMKTRSKKKHRRRRTSKRSSVRSGR